MSGPIVLEPDDLRTRLSRAGDLIAQADGLMITAGAGLGVDSGLPDFRGHEGMWRAYPALGRARMRFEEIACPAAFRRRPRLAWGFYGHRLKLYRETGPGPAFGMFKAIAQRLRHGAFVFTSNVDGHFQKAGFDEARIVECHGSIHYLQCLDNCHDGTWPADDYRPQVDEERCELVGELPRCPRCNGLARPNILMFGDGEWIDGRMSDQWERLSAWRRHVDHLVVLEVGAGTAIPTVRLFGANQGVPLIRANPAEPGVSRSHDVSLPATAAEAARGIAAALVEAGFINRAEGERSGSARLTSATESSGCSGTAQSCDQSPRR